jgi:hypothetical protein
MPGDSQPLSLQHYEHKQRRFGSFYATLLPEKSYPEVMLWQSLSMFSREVLSMKKRIVILTVAGVAVAAVVFLVIGRSGGENSDTLPAIKVTRDNIVDKALAVGTIEPENEISIKSKVSGVVRSIFADA